MTLSQGRNVVRFCTGTTYLIPLFFFSERTVDFNFFLFYFESGSGTAERIRKFSGYPIVHREVPDLAPDVFKMMSVLICLSFRPLIALNEMFL